MDVARKRGGGGRGGKGEGCDGMWFFSAGCGRGGVVGGGGGVGAGKGKKNINKIIYNLELINICQSSWDDASRRVPKCVAAVALHRFPSTSLKFYIKF